MEAAPRGECLVSDPLEGNPLRVRVGECPGCKDHCEALYSRCIDHCPNEHFPDFTECINDCIQVFQIDCEKGCPC